MMGYLQLPSGVPNFSKAVFSFWVRIESASLATAKSNYNNDVGVTEDANGNKINPPFFGVIPLVTFGKSDLEGYFIKNNEVVTGGYTIKYRFFDPFPHTCEYATVQPDADIVLTSPQTVKGTTYTLDPCYIGVSARDDDTAPLVINIQFAETASEASGVAFDVVNRDNGQLPGKPPERMELLGVGLAYNECDAPNKPITFTAFAPPQDATDAVRVHPDYAQPFMEKWTYGDVTSVFFQRNRENFCIQAGNIVPDRWHHILVSLDLSGEIVATGMKGDVSGGTGKVTSKCKLWIAIDNVNILNKDWKLLDGINKYELPHFKLGPNDLLTSHAYQTGSAFSRHAYSDGP